MIVTYNELYSLTQKYKKLYEGEYLQENLNIIKNVPYVFDILPNKLDLVWEAGLNLINCGKILDFLYCTIQMVPKI